MKSLLNISLSLVLTFSMVTLLNVSAMADNNDDLAASVLKEYNLHQRLQQVQIDHTYNIVIIDKDENMLYKGNQDQKNTLKLMHQSNFLIEIEGVQYFQIKKEGKVLKQALNLKK